MSKGLEMVDEFLVYGRLNLEDKRFLDFNNVFTQCIDEFTNMPYPNIQETELEIEEIIRYQKALDSPNKTERWENRDFVTDCDFNVKEVLEREYAKMGIDYKMLESRIDRIMNDLGGLVMQLKVFYNRPRAYQVAYYTKQNFNPSATISGNSPAYPSGHSTQSWFMGLYVSGLFPQQKNKIMRLASDIADTRLALGVHYPSDQEFGKMIAHTLYKKPKIQKTIYSEKYYE